MRRKNQGGERKGKQRQKEGGRTRYKGFRGGTKNRRGEGNDQKGGAEEGGRRKEGRRGRRRRRWESEVKAEPSPGGE